MNCVLSSVISYYNSLKDLFIEELISQVILSLEDSDEDYFVSDYTVTIYENGEEEELEFIPFLIKRKFGEDGLYAYNSLIDEEIIFEEVA